MFKIHSHSHINGKDHFVCFTYLQMKIMRNFFSLLKSLVHQRRHFSCDLIMHATSNYIIHSQLLLWEKHDQSMLVFCFTINPIVSMNDLCGPRNEVTYICCLEFVLSLNVVYFANPTTKELFDFSFNGNTLSSYEMGVKETYINYKDRNSP